MGNQLVWNNRYNLGVEIIDKEHKKLFSILNKLFDFGQQEDKSQWVCQEAVKYFKDHALQHFIDEEAYMASINYAGIDIHRRIHKNFRETTLPALEKELNATGYSQDAVNHFLGVCAGWLIGHTTIEDHAIVSGETVKQWENLLPDEEQAVMGQAIISRLYTMFQLNSKLISNCYGGEKFGNGIYYRLIYITREKKRWEFMLIFEEQLIVSTIGNVIETKSESLNVMIMNVARYTARQLVEHLKEHFAELHDAKIKEEQLLTYEQFQKVFEKHSPQFSLLFDTGKGYFSYCMTTSDMVPSEDGISIITENAMSAVENYLKQNKAESIAASLKKKVLVVDDSDFMLAMMQKLLENDYEVLTATSGLSAIRSITLNRPDLVLLDYEMPEMNGKEVFETMLGDEDLKYIPVVFLTSVSDRKAVFSILQSKPAGYILKPADQENLLKTVQEILRK